MAYLMAVCQLLIALIICQECLGKSVDPSCDSVAKSISTAEKYDKQTKEGFINFFRVCIVEKYNYKMAADIQDTDKENYNRFEGLPNFKDAKPSPLLISSDEDNSFENYAAAIEKFFTLAGSMETIMKDEFMKRKDNGKTNCKNLLYVMAARHIYYTYLLRKLTQGTQFCEKDKNDKILIPERVCYKEAGSLTCTSDADIGLVGPKAGETVKLYNEYITNLKCGPNKVTCTPDSMMDNNMYAYSLELATPELYTSADDNKKKAMENRKKLLKKLDEDDVYNWLDIILAMMQMVRQKYHSFHRKITDEVFKDLDKDVESLNYEFLKDTMGEGSDLNAKIQQLNSYSTLVKEIQDKTTGDFDEEMVKDVVIAVLKSHIKATESYHSFGALRTVVVSMQMKRKEMVDRLSLNDYVASAIENLGYAYKYLSDCKGSQSASQCIADSSKYMWRLYACLHAAAGVLKANGDNNIDQEKTKKARDYLEELLFVFKKNKKDVDASYESKLGPKGKKVDADKLMRESLGCSGEGSCLLKIEKDVLDVVGSLGKMRKSGRVRFIDKNINEEYFKYVTSV